MDFTYKEALALLKKTTPFLLFRILVYGGIAVAWIIITGIGAGIGAAIGVIGGSASGGAFVGGLIAFAACGGVLRVLRRYLLYLVKGAHIAVLVEAIDGRPLPAGKGQVAFGQQAVKERFVEMSVFAGIDAIISAVLKAFTRLVDFVAGILPIPGLRAVAGIGSAIVTNSLTYVDEAIIAHNLRVRSTNPWETSRQGLILYAQNYPRFLKNSVKLTLGVWGLTVLIFLVYLAPIALFIWILPVQGNLVALLIAFSLAWATKVALLEPFAVAAILVAWPKIIAGQVPNPEWEAKLSQASKKFGDMAGKAREWATKNRSQPPQQPASPALGSPQAPPAPPAPTTPAPPAPPAPPGAGTPPNTPPTA
ncbi:hypothetical protein [Microbacterium amylolyticum]|uniref:Uncharacterized protein n=1 Tax=Microbacterium amylolyticum TaxID=936337 RepID=A0ABS4ZJA5_9MICO|nr:hypothetical protein [Microbacterium amylolyticum]MBP2437360.1 hypothetical protein [Microbacterium amylolyticum]